IPVTICAVMRSGSAMRADRHRQRRQRRRSKRNQDVRPEAGGFLPVLAFESDRGPESGCEQQSPQKIHGRHAAIMAREKAEKVTYGFGGRVAGMLTASTSSMRRP